MSRKEADQLEQSLQQAAQGETIEGKLLPLVETARLLSALAEPPPPPPGRLLPGRQRFLSEATRLQAARSTRQKGTAWGANRLRLAGALIVALLVVGLVFMGPVAAGSLPGTPLYGLKLVVEQARWGLTAEPEARAALATTLTQERLEEIGRLLAKGQVIDAATTSRASTQLALALTAADQLEGQARLQALQRLDNVVQAHLSAMTQALDGLPESEQPTLRELVREMERVRQELRNGQGQPGGEPNRQRYGTPPVPTRTPGTTGQPSPGPQPTHTPIAPRPTEGAGPGPGPQPSEKPGEPRPTAGAGPGPGPQPTHTPIAPRPTEGAGPGPGPQPTQQPGPQPTQESGPQPTQGPGPGPQPTQGPGPQQTREPGGGTPPGDDGGGGGKKP